MKFKLSYLKFALIFLPLLLPFTAFADYTINSGSSGTPGAGYTFGYSSTNSSAVAQRFVTSTAGTMNNLTTQLDVGGSTGLVTATIYNDTLTTSLGSDTETLTASCGNTVFNFSPAISLAATTHYYIVFTRTSGYSTTDYYGSYCGNSGTNTDYIELRCDNDTNYSSCSNFSNYYGPLQITVVTGGGGGSGTSSVSVATSTPETVAIDNVTFGLACIFFILCLFGFAFFTSSYTKTK